ncbi:hypothetical protein LWI29_038546 [Acer saccharum]|uniref:RNase H type-1 domain-containing protein n=1 Tax=Acer saccharum TaxID=4024 RepID=A0AA39T1F8_ACESA|nr:hypothetical protein LWI29_038546 [Acer saccharum]
MDKFVRCSILRISREHNSQADELAKLASSSDMKLPRTVTVFRLLESSITEEPVVHAVIPEYGPDTDTWMAPIMKFLQDGTLPEEKSASLRVRRQSPRYLLINRVLYRRGYSLPYLRCIAPPQTDLVLQEVHGGTCGSHSVRANLGHRITRQGSASMKGAYKLKTEDGTPLKNPWNAEHLKKYYQ